MESSLDRRVYQREFEQVLGYGASWFRALERRGVIPAGRRDPGGKRKWWLASDVRATLDKLTAAAVRADDDRAAA